MSMVWSQIFLMGICFDCFLPKTLIHLWNFFGTSFFAPSSDLAASSSLSQIFHFSATLFTSTIFLSFSFLFSRSSHFCPASPLVSSSFYFSQPNFPWTSLHCLPHFSEHLIIFTSSVLQSISGLWCASHGIPKITVYFCLPIISISVLSLYPW